MGRRPGRSHSPAFKVKAKVALEAAKEEQTLAQLVQQFDLHPNQITQWKNLLLNRATEVLENSAQPSDPPVDVKTLHAKIGQLTLENDFLKEAPTSFATDLSSQGAPIEPQQPLLPTTTRLRAGSTPDEEDR